MKININGNLTELDKPMSVVTFRLDPDTYLRVLAMAEREDRTFSDIIRQAINYYLRELN